MAFSATDIHFNPESSTRTDKDSGGDSFGGFVDNQSGKQLPNDAEATVMRQRGGYICGSQCKLYSYAQYQRRIRWSYKDQPYRKLPSPTS